MELGNEFKKKYGLYLVSSIFIGYLAWLLIEVYVKGSENIIFLNYIISSILLYTLVFLVLKQVNYKKYSYLLLMMLGTYYIIFLPLFSPIDEGAHFDYILHIIQNHRLPTLYDLINTNNLFKVTDNLVPSNIQYEAVHPPLYYLISAAIVVLFQKNLLACLIVLRLFGIFLILMTYYFTSKTYEELVRKNIVQQNDHLFYSITLVFYLSPGFMTRMITVSNEQLVVTLMALLIYIIVKKIGKKTDFRQLIDLSLVSAGMILTKFTSVYVIGVLVLLFLFYKEIKKAIIYVFFTMVLISPWIIYNFFHYKNFTGTGLHVEFVKNIVNPENIQLTLYYISQKITFFFSTFWNPQESGFQNMREPYYMITILLNWLMVGVILMATIYSINALKNISNKLNQLVIILSSSIILNILILCYGTITEDVDIIIGRYLYMNAISFIILTFIFIQKTIIVKNQKYLGYFLLIMSCSLAINFMLDTAQSKQNLVVKIKNRVLIESINIENYQDKDYDSLLSNQNLNDIPLSMNSSDLEGIEIKDLVDDNFSFINSMRLTDSRKLEIIGNDPFFVISNETILTKADDIIKVTISHNSPKDGTAQLFWDDGEGFSEEKSIKFNIAKGSESYILPIGRNPAWISSNKVIQIRFDLDNFDGNEMFDVQEFGMLKANR